MKRLLIRFLTFMDSNNKGLFVGCWFLLMFPLFSRVMEIFSIEDDAPGPSDSQQIVMIVTLIMSVWGWKVLWKILERERFLPIRNAIITMGGFALIHFMFIFPALFFAVLLDFLVPKGIGRLVTTSLVFVAPFIGGCWIGFKRSRLIWLWCAAGVILYWLFVGIVASETDFMGTTEMIPYLLFAIMGGYYADHFLCEEEASDPLSRMPYQPRD